VGLDGVGCDGREQLGMGIWGYGGVGVLEAVAVEAWESSPGRKKAFPGVEVWGASKRGGSNVATPACFDVKTFSF